MGRYSALGAKASQILLQDTIDAADIIGRWEYDVPSDRAYSDALVALVFNVDPVLAAAGTPISTFMAGIHPEDREKAILEIQRSIQTGLCCTLKYRVCSADGVIRRVLDRGRFTLDRKGQAQRGSGVLIDVTHRDLEAEGILPAGSETRPSLERVAEHCLAAKVLLQDLPEPLLNRLNDVLLLEIARSLAKAASERRRASLS